MNGAIAALHMATGNPGKYANATRQNQIAFAAFAGSSEGTMASAPDGALPSGKRLFLRLSMPMGHKRAYKLHIYPGYSLSRG